MPTYVIPPDTRAPGTGNPAQDVDQLSDIEGLLAAILAGQAGFPGNTQIPAGNTLNIQALQPYLNGLYTGIGLVPSGGNDAVNVQGLINLGVKVIYLQAGTFTASTGVTSSAPPTYINGAGNDATIWNFTGSGDAFRFYSTQTYLSGWGGGIKWMTIDGFNSAGTGSTGIHAGDIYQLEWDCGVRGFRADVTAKGVYFDNQYFYAEEMRGRLWVEQNANNVVFDNSANLSAGFQATGSFKGTQLDITVDAKGSGNILVLQGGAYVYESDIRLKGNIDYAGSVGQGPFSVLTLTGPGTLSFTATNATPCVFTAAGAHPYNGQEAFLTGASLPTGFTAGTVYFVTATNPVAGTFELAATNGGAAIASTSTGSGTVQFLPYSQMIHGDLRVGVECNAVNANNQPITITFASQGNNVILDCTGYMDFTANNPFAGAVNPQGSIRFMGPIYGDNKLQSAGEIGLYPFKFSGSGPGGNVANGDNITTRFFRLVEVTTAANVTGVKLQGFNPENWRQITVMNNGTGTITFAAQATSNVLGGTSNVIQPNSSATFTFNVDLSLWFMASPVPLTPAAILDNISSGVVAETVPRDLCGTYFSGLTSQTVYVSAIPLLAGQVVTNLALMVGGIAFTVVTHGWYALLDSTRTVKAVSADQSSGNWTSTFTAVSLAMGTPFTAPSTGIYYFAFCATFSTSGEFPSSAGILGGLGGAAGPFSLLFGVSSTGLSTPPSVGTQLAAFTQPASTGRFHGWAT